MKKIRLLISLLLCLTLVMLSISVAFAASDLKAIPFSKIPGIKVGHVTDAKNGTGCTVVIAENPNGAITGVDVRGGSPGTRETDLLDPTKTVQTANAVVLAGGSAYGLAAADGVMTYLEKLKMGVNVGVTVVPIVPSAILFDLGFGNAFVRPNSAMGYTAAENAFKNLPWADGNVGAGTGATVGKGTTAIGGSAMKGGLGSFAFQYGDLYVGAIVAVNSVGNIVDPNTGAIIAGAITKDNKFIDMEDWTMNSRYTPPKSTQNTTIGIIVTNANLNQAQAKKLAEMAHDGYARSIRPVHTAGDGDTIFAMSLGGVESSATTWNRVDANMNLIGVLAVNAMSQAVANAGRSATTLLDVQGAASLTTAPTQPTKTPLNY